MNSDEIKAVWAARITSSSELSAAFNRTRPYSNAIESVSVAPFLATNGSDVGLSSDSIDLWFLRREAYREAAGVYPEATSVIRWLRNNIAKQHFPHVSHEDPSMVAYTPDRQSGINDRQVRTTMGKLLRKFLLVVPDAEIARLEARHRAEMDTSFETANTIEAIEAAFVVAGDGSCMRYGKEHWGLNDYHVSAAYAAPGMGIAYTKNERGLVNARTVIWTNPEDAADKRYVRIYGDQALKRRLESAGYRLAGLAGAKLAALKDSAYPHEFVMPWIDPAGGIYGGTTSEQKQLDAAHVVKFKGEPYLRLVSAEQAQQYLNAGLPVTSARHQAGRIALDEIDETSLSYTCALTGEQVNRMTTPTLHWITPDGVVRQATAAAVSALGRDAHVWAMTRYEGGTTVRARCSAETHAKYAVPGFPSYYNDAETRAVAGLVQLSEAHYAPDTYTARSMAYRTTDSTWVLRTDTLRVFDEDGAERYEHVDAGKALRKAGYTSTAVLGKTKVMSHKNNPDLVTTVGGRKVLKGYHNVQELTDGRWEYVANTASLILMGHCLTVAKGEPYESMTVTPETLDRIYGTHLRAARDQTNLRRRMGDMLRHGIKLDSTVMCNAYYMDGGHLSERSYWRDCTLEQAEAGVHKLLELEAAPEQFNNTVGTYRAVAALRWAQAAVQVLAMYHAERRRLALELAEADAVEAPHRLGTANDATFVQAA